MPSPTDPSKNYALPADNPTSIAGIEGSAVGTGIYAAGLRNPWRVSFDRLTGDMYIGDVGETIVRGDQSRKVRRQLRMERHGGVFQPGSFPSYTNPIYAYGRDRGQR